MIDIKIIRKPKNKDGASVVRTGGSACGETAAREAAHAARADEATLAVRAMEAGHAGRADNARHADSSRTVDDDSPLYDRFLRKDRDDTASGLVTFLRGVVAKARSFFAGIENTGDIVNSGDITTRNLTVTGLARFFKLVIDQIRSVGGAYISSPADGFEIDKVEALYETGSGGAVRLFTSGGKYIPSNGKALSCRQETSAVGVPVRYRLYWRSTDGRKTRVNMWKVGDQALSMDFNNAQKGAAADVANNYWWSCVLAVSSGPAEVEIDGENELCHYIEVSNEGSCADGVYTAAVNTQGWDAFNRTKGAPMWTGALKPSEGDAVTMLGHRLVSAADKDRSRQSAVYESCYASLDPEITPPLKAYYKGIDDFSLAKHRGTYDDAYGSEIVGRIRVVSKGDGGETTTKPLDEYIDEKAGDGGVQYVLVPSPGVIHVGQDGTMSADRVTPRITKLEGGKGRASWSVTEAKANGLAVGYRTSRMGAHVYLNADYVAVAANVDYIEFKLLSGSGDVDIKAVPVVREGKDGKPGEDGKPGTPGEPGKDGADAYEVVCDPQALVFNTDDDGTLSAESTTVHVSLRKGGLPADISGKVSLVQESCVNIASGGIGMGDNATVTVDPAAIDSDDNGIVCTSASFRISVAFDGRQYYADILISVNVNAYLSKIESDARQYKRDFDQFRGDETSLTHFRTGLLQTAREISLEATENDARRNMLAGTAFRRLEEITWGNPAYPQGISKLHHYNGTNSVHLSFNGSTETFMGVTYGDVAVKENTTYTLSFLVKKDSTPTLSYSAFEVSYGTYPNVTRIVNESFHDKVTAADVWTLITKTFTTPSGVTSIRIPIYVVYGGSCYIARPMLEEADKYKGWTLSEQDDDCIGGNIIAGTRLLSGGNISLPSGAVRTENGYGEFATVSKSNGSGNNDMLNVAGLTMFAQKEYILSLMLKGSGKLSVNWGHGVYFAESSTGQESICTEKNGNANRSGYTEIEASSDWRMVYVHIRTMDSDVPNSICLGSAGGTYSLSIAALKLEAGATVTEWTDSTKTISFRHGSYGAYIRETARQIEMNVTDGVNRAGLRLGSDGGFTATGQNFWFLNNNNEPVLALTADGKLRADLIEAHRVSAWNIAQMFETYADLAALMSGKSLSWVIKTAGDYSQLMTNERMNGTMLNVLNASPGVVTFRILFVGLTDDKPANTATVSIPKLTMFRAVGVPVDIPGSPTQIAFYCLVPYIVSGTNVTVQRPSFKKTTIGGMQRPILEEH